ncbi:MAG TPA: GNAT family N-acetyltransferase [Candidatus Kapabacteria bacterium]|jgi:RimJ/RimL family protein N-acetyltransferase
MIETSRLLLREYTLEDVPSLNRIQSDPITMKFWASPFTEEHSRNWIERAIASYAANGFGRWALLLKETNAQIGDAGLMRVEVNGNPEVDLGYILQADRWQKGYATEAALAILRFGKEKGLPRMIAHMAHDHTKSQRVAERLGMRKETEFVNPRNRNIVHSLYAWNAPRS